LLEGDALLMKMSISFACNASVAAAMLAAALGLNAQQGQNWSPPAFHPRELTQQLQELCAQEEKTDAAEVAALNTYSSPVLEKALGSGPEFWRFLIDPVTPYMDRMAAAQRGGGMIGPTDLPTLWKAVADFEAHRSGVAGPPCVYLRSDNRRPEDWVHRNQWLMSQAAADRSYTILGQKVDLPDKMTDFPITPAEREKAPWPWQMARALAALETKVEIYYGDPIRYPLLVDAAWGWQPGNWQGASVRSRALLGREPRNALRLKTIVRLALDDPDPNVNSGVPTDLNVWGTDSYQFEELTHVAQIVILQKTQKEPVAASTAYSIGSLARLRDNSCCPQLKPLRTATAILAMGKWAMDRNLSAWDRYASFVDPIYKAVATPPFQPGTIRDPRSPELAKSLMAFEEWFKSQRSSLEQQAAEERPHLQSLASELSQQIK
jgi:hypothetical protein